MGTILLTLMIGFSSQGETHLAPDAAQVLNAMTKNNFDCEIRSRSSGRGFGCQGRILGYPEPVHIFVPPYFSNQRPILVLFYFHGWRLNRNDHPFRGEAGDFGRFVSDSGANAIIVAPESVGRNETFEKHLKRLDQLQNFFARSLAFLKASSVELEKDSGHALAIHSGAYVLLGRLGSMIAEGEMKHLLNLQGIALFDSAYGYRSGLVDVVDELCRSPEAHYWLAYHPSDGSKDKRQTNEQILAELKQRKACPQLQIRSFPDSTVAHMDFPQAYMSRFLAEFVEF